MSNEEGSSKIDPEAAAAIQKLLVIDVYELKSRNELKSEEKMSETNDLIWFFKRGEGSICILFFRSI